MKTSDVIAHYGSIARAAKALNLSRHSVYQWGEEVPPARQYELEVKTAGALISDYSREQAAGTPSGRRKRGKR
ncbi:Cro/CI family transcriptional regulator [Pantoea stewartii]|uniref:Cro repressor n=1 Tax=Pantoea stewartii subsp. stewartii DC283 TaxID=660596 RepID=H3RLJ0_PANSE|nr:Cro/CI family transcriptional regulator [Pantoea stewartii]ARF52749.1 Cro/Cl family transcriptional regulator [Pantoea stewartii subsp. stewartii DC283]EHT97703.1 Cro repressor [Pantoea stewartii subsp. stewartii DC283]KAB0554018.1 Cro/Cl family transcriptional regulator [Pantoea stewartii subsp. stewartii]